MAANAASARVRSRISALRRFNSGCYAYGSCTAPRQRLRARWCRRLAHHQRIAALAICCAAPLCSLFPALHGLFIFAMPCCTRI